ncbi:hypothetical protein HZS_4888 [Henneguya salminicola]|nr:hypothetical protein HZS_4888 [Henneguya salminicola]
MREVKFLWHEVGVLLLFYINTIFYLAAIMTTNKKNILKYITILYSCKFLNYPLDVNIHKIIFFLIFVNMEFDV